MFKSKKPQIATDTNEYRAWHSFVVYCLSRGWYLKEAVKEADRYILAARDRGMEPMTLEVVTP